MASGWPGGGPTEEEVGPLPGDDPSGEEEEESPEPAEAEDEGPELPGCPAVWLPATTQQYSLQSDFTPEFSGEAHLCKIYCRHPSPMSYPSEYPK